MAHTHYRLFLIVLILLYLAGCGSSAVRTGAASRGGGDEMQKAERLEGIGEHAIAAQLLRKLAAEAEPPRKQGLELRAVENLLRAGKLDAAEALLDEVDLRAVAGYRFYGEVLRGEMALARNRPELTLERLQQGPPQQVPFGLVQRYYQARAEALSRLGRPLESARELTELDGRIRLRDERVRNQLAILRVLSGVSGASLDLLQSRHPGDLGGWMDLTGILRQGSGGRDELASGLQGWRQRHPAHPALSDAVNAFLDELKKTLKNVGEIAVLLPQTGPYREVSEALQDGLMAAYFATPSVRRPRLMFYDTEGAGVQALYQQAVQAGAQLVVGPLDKNRVVELAALGAFPTPVLALNQLPREFQPPANFYRFALAPEDDAREVAERAWSEGYGAAVVLAPRGDWGERIETAFAERWQSLGGVVAETTIYEPQTHDFSSAIQDLLNLEESEQRRSDLQGILGRRLGFEPQVRPEAEFIFVVGKADKVRQIRPQLQFYRAGSVPVFATSHVYEGWPDQRRDQDLSGVGFAEIPWMLGPAADERLGRERFVRLFPQSARHFPRLYAMGMDSFRVAQGLGALRQDAGRAIRGDTGRLSLDPSGRVNRDLAWGRFVDGAPVLAERAAPEAGAAADSRVQTAPLAIRRAGDLAR